jgi:signal transduction histidine kinase
MRKSKASKAEHGRRRQERAGSKLALLLKQHQEEITTAWTEMVLGLPDSPYGGRPPEEVRPLTQRGVEAIVESLETGFHALLDEYLSDICPAASDGIPDTSAVAEALLLCKRAAVPIIREACGPDSDAAWTLVSELDTCLRQMVGRLTSTCAAGMRRQLQDEGAQVQMLLDMAQAVGSTPELSEVVSRVSGAIVTALGVDRCVFHLVDEEQSRVVRLPEPSDWSSRALASFDSFTGAFHEVLATGEPLVSYDVWSDPRFSRDDPAVLGVKSVLGVPLKVRGKVIAVAWAHTVHDHCHFGSDEIKLAQGMGNMLGLIIQNAQLHEQSKLLAVMEERGRLAREIHDGIAQTLGALQLKASQLEGSFPSQHIDEPRDHLTELQEMISRAYRDLREAMFGLHAVVEPGTGLVPALREYLAHYQDQYGLDVRLEASEDEPAVLDGETQAQVMRIVQEALRNVLRHAGTGRATVRVERSGDSLRLRIMDEGQGFEPGFVEEREDGRYLGLRTMRERAESVGGTLSVDSKPGQGTRVVLQLRILGDGGVA